MVDIGFQAAEVGLEAVAKNLQHKEQVSSPPLSGNTRSHGTSRDSCPSLEEDQEELPQEEEQACKPQVAAPPAASAAATIEASGSFSVRIRKWW